MKEKIRELEERIEFLESILLPRSKKQTQSLFNEIVYPFESDKFYKTWAKWKLYKYKEFKFRYKSLESEQTSLTRLYELSNQIESDACEIIEQSIANGWKGFFAVQPKPKPHTTVKETTFVKNR